MRRSLEGPYRLGGVWIGAVVETEFHVSERRGQWHGAGAKHPMALIILDGTALSAFTPQGAPMREAQLERLCPGCAARMRNVARQAADT